MPRKRKKSPPARTRKANDYRGVLSSIVQLLDQARHTAARSVNVVMTVTYWEIGQRIVEFEQGGAERAKYGERLLEQLSADLTRRFGRGFGIVNLTQMRRFYLAWPTTPILQTASEESSRPILQTASEESSRPILQTASEESSTVEMDAPAQSGRAAGHMSVFPLPWSHYVQLLKVADADARRFYETEALRSGWTVRQLERQITTLFYERALASRKKSAVLRKGAEITLQDIVTAEEEIRDPLVLEFLNLKDEYSESDLEEALIQQLESFLLELGGDFTFVGRQRRLRIGDDWYRIDLLLFHRRLRCLVVIDLKLGKFTHADAGQMTLYLNYAAEHWTIAEENPPVGLILCTQKDAAVAHYALNGLPNKVLAAEYRTRLPKERMLANELKRRRRHIESRQSTPTRH